MTRILIGALSGWKYHERRQRCLATWMADADQVDVRSVFLLGCPTATVPEELGWHYLALPCPDDYPSLPQRTLWFCRWALKRDDWDYLFKCDDDTYVSIPRLLAYDCAGRSYLGAEWKRGVNYGSGGAGYLIDRRSAEIIAGQSVPTNGAEDVWVGRVLRAAGIWLSIEPRLIPFGSMARRPKRENNLLTLHAAEPDAFMAAHAETGLRANGRL